jgi:hypothetical protein
MLDPEGISEGPEGFRRVFFFFVILTISIVNELLPSSHNSVYKFPV